MKIPGKLYDIEVQICISPYHFLGGKLKDPLFLLDPSKGEEKMRKDIEEYFKENLPKYYFLPSKNPYYIHLGINSDDYDVYDIVKLKDFYTHDEMGLKSSIASFDIINYEEGTNVDFIERESKMRSDIIEIMESKAIMGDKDSAAAYKEMTEFDKEHPFMSADERDDVMNSLDYC